MAHSLQTYIGGLTGRINNLDLNDSLKLLAELFPNRVTFSSSFGFEDQAITHAIASNSLPISIFTLDTGRLFAETYAVWNNTIEKYKTPITVYHPDNNLLEEFISEKGPN